MNFYHFRQNNSGGYFKNNDELGVCENIIIEAETAKQANKKLDAIGESMDDFWDFCSCCGERWYHCSESDADPEPQIYSTPIRNMSKESFHNRCFVHYADGSVKEFKFKE